MRRTLPLVLIASGCVLALLLICYGSVLVRDHQFAYRDAAHFYYPLYQRVQQEWAAGRLPLWSPEENAGMPLLGNPTAAVLYPAKLIFAVAPSYAWGVRLYTIAHTLLALAAMYALTRHWGVSRAGSTLAAIAYGFGGPILFQYCNIIFLVGAAWAPLAIRAADRWLRLGSRWAIGELALILTMQTLGGDPQAAYLVGLCAGGYALGLARSRREPDRRRPPAWAVVSGLLVLLAIWSGAALAAAEYLPRFRPTGMPPARLPWMPYLDLAIRLTWGIAAVGLLLAWRRRPGLPLPIMLTGLVGSAGLAAALAAVQLLPVLEFTGQSVRAAGQGPHDIYPFSLEPVRLVEFAFPNFFGTGFGGNHLWLNLAPLVRKPDVWVPSLYLGGLTLVLALGAAGFRGGPPWRAWMTAVALASLLGASGKFGSPLWVGRHFPEVAQRVGPLDAKDSAAIRFDGHLRDGDGGFYWLLSTVLPGFREFRYPSKLLTFTCLALCALAGLGWDRVVAGFRGRATAVATGLGVVALAGAAFVLIRRGSIVSAFRAAEAPGSSLGPFEPEGAWAELSWALVQGSIVLGLSLAVVRLAPSRPRVVAALAMILLAADLAVANSSMVLTAPQAMFETKPELLERIEQFEREDPTPGGLYRLHRMPMWNPLGWLETPDPLRYREFVRWERKTLQPKYGIPYGLQYTFVEGTAELYDYVFFFAAFEGLHDPALAQKFLGDPNARIIAYARRGFDLWNTRYFLLPSRPGNDEYRGIASFMFDAEPLTPPLGTPAELEGWERFEDWRLWRNQAVYPRAWVVHQVRTPKPISGLDRVDREKTMYEILYQADPLWTMRSRPEVHDPRELAWVETDDPTSVRSRLSGWPPDPSELPRISGYEPQRVEIEVDLKSPGLVILADVYYPGWKLTIDGDPATILRTNRMMRGALVESGRHTLVYTYDPPLLRVGATVTGLGLFALAALGLWSARRPVSTSLGPQDPEEAMGD